MTDRDPTTRTEAEGATLDLPEGRPLAPGQVSGQRFRIVSQLGRGGMGEVWRAFDLKLRVEVALKALRPELLADPRRLDLLRQEVRVARQVTSPNVCRIYDLVEVEGRELVSMEYIDGRTLLDELRQRAPFDPSEAQAIVAQLLSGLEAIHEAGLVHRDIKPENIMLTRTGRVVVMDFGIARSPAEGAGSVSGTPAYMAPEQARGEAADLRSDIFSVGVMLAEMVSPEGIRDVESRQSVWQGLRRDPVEVPQSPWAGVIRKAVAKDPADRFASTAELQRALEDLAFRVHDETGLDPYPGLAAFDVSDREYFFGREAEVEAVWTRLESAHLLAVVGASGVGKSSFLGAGVIPARPAGWGVLRCTPGDQAVGALRRAVEEATGEEIAGDDDSLVAALTSWRLRHDQALLIVDQFEEVFTQNPADEQRRVAALIGRLVLDADVHVLLSLRDDFLLRCHEHAELAPVFSELTPLRTPVGGALRRAVVQPALRCGYRFEDDELADELLAEVEGERGALPLLAFALASLWQRRDRESGLLTRTAFHDIGGVGGALARHAEATIDRIGSERIGIVRELFRNLVTAEGTRAVREWGELLSVFTEPRRESAEEVLRALIDARLLTSYEVEGKEEAPTRRVEIIHESLLSAWPRLVRWQTQDADAAQLRDQLRQAANTWEEHDRSDDLLWAGAAYREYAVWRERYPGGLTEAEEAFASAMTSLATRRRRRRRAAVAAVLVIAGIVTASTTALWRRSVAEANRAEAANLVFLGQPELETNPSATVAYTIASLEQADNQGARHLALKALLRGPTALVATEDFVWRCRFGPQGKWLVQDEWIQAKRPEGHLSVIRAEGTRYYLENAHCEATHLFLPFLADSGQFVSASLCADSTWQSVVWSMPEGRPLATFRGHRVRWADDANRRRLVLVYFDGTNTVVDTIGYDGSTTHLGTLEAPYSTFRQWVAHTRFDPQDGRWLATLDEQQILVFEIGDESLSEIFRLKQAVGTTPSGMARPIDVFGKGSWLTIFFPEEAQMYQIGDNGITESRHLLPVDGANAGFDIDPQGRFVAASDASGNIRIWNLHDQSPPAVLQGPPGNPLLFFSDEGSHLTTDSGQDGHVIEWAWSLADS
ncbi:MAG: protein kinase, partial [Acidobacteriota bacterium]